MVVDLKIDYEKIKGVIEMKNDAQWIEIRDIIADIVLGDSNICYESYDDGYVSEDDFYVDNSEDVAEKIINKLIEMGKLENV